MPELTVLTTVTGSVSDAAQTYEDVYAFHNWLSGKLAGPPWAGNVDWLTRVPPFVVVSQPAAGNWIMLFASPTDQAPKLRRVTYDMSVSKVWADAAGVVWLKVFDAPGMWVLAAQVKLKS